MDSPSASHLAPLLTTDELATILGCTPNWLAKLRMERSGPPFVRIGALIRYRTDDVERWLDRQSVETDNGSPAVPVPRAHASDVATRVTPDVAAA